jgi:NAD(P)-dependent dehydrogenase (short-subunit alcohol dehydrogenase family)
MSRLGYKVAIVTGGAEGFGAAEALAADGATVLLTG